MKNSEDRELLIGTAVKFLQNPNVQHTSVTKKKSFLTSKGLSDTEIEKALQLSGVLEQDKDPNHGLSSPAISTQPYAFSNLSPSSGPSRWSQFRDVVSFVFVAGGGTYALYRIYQDVVKPLVTGQRPVSHYEQMISELRSVNENVKDTLTSVQGTLTAVQTTLAHQQSQIDAIARSLADRPGENLHTFRDARTVDEIKSEITSLKGLLLNRHQFPPTLPATIPAWQLSQTNRNASHDATSDSETETKTGSATDKTDNNHKTGSDVMLT